MPRCAALSTVMKIDERPIADLMGLLEKVNLKAVYPAFHPGINNHSAAQVIPMSMISCDMRYGHSDEQKRALSTGLLRHQRSDWRTCRQYLLCYKEGRGINFVEHGQHLPEFVEGNANDKELISRLK